MIRIPIGLSLVVGLASCVIPPQTQAQPVPWGAQPGQQQGWQQGQPQAAASPPASAGTCEDACGQIARCEIAPYDACLGACEDVTAEQLDAIAQSSCQELAASMQSTPSSSAEVATVNEAPSTRVAGRWVSTEWASVTNPAMTSADFYLSITVGNDGGFHGSWARYICLSSAYGIISCSLGPIEGSASGRLDADGGGRIELERLGSSALAWTAKSAGELSIELPRDWQGELVLFRSSVKR